MMTRHSRSLIFGKAHTGFSHVASATRSFKIARDRQATFRKWLYVVHCRGIFRMRVGTLHHTTAIAALIIISLIDSRANIFRYPPHYLPPELGVEAISTVTRSTICDQLATAASTKPKPL